SAVVSPGTTEPALALATNSAANNAQRALRLLPTLRSSWSYSNLFRHVFAFVSLAPSVDGPPLMVRSAGPLQRYTRILRHGPSASGDRRKNPDAHHITVRIGALDTVFGNTL